MASVAGTYCYVASEATGVRMFNVANPASTTEAGYYDGVPQSRGVTANGQYVYVAEKADGLSIYSNDLATAIREEGATPREFRLEQNFPNPFNPSTQIRFSVPSKGMVTLKVFDLLGREITVLMQEVLEPGSYVSRFNAMNLTSGTYFYTLIAGNHRMTQKMILMK
jgi:hypothetical protein